MSDVYVNNVLSMQHHTEQYVSVSHHSVVYRSIATTGLMGELTKPMTTTQNKHHLKLIDIIFESATTQFDQLQAYGHSDD